MKKITLLALFLFYSVLTFGQTPCDNISPLDCNQVQVNLPLDLNFNGSDGGILSTGFTMVDPPSSRLTADEAGADADVTGLLSGNLTLTGGTLEVNATKGINFRQLSGNLSSGNTNSQMNALGAGFAPNSNIINVKATFAQPDFNTSTPDNRAQQAGIWLGLNENNFVKLVAADRPGTSAQRFQLALEQTDGATAGSGNTTMNIVELNTGDVSSNGVSNITLRISIDPSNNIITGFYSLDGAPEVQVTGATSSLTAPATFLAGVDHDSNATTEALTYAGIMTTTRNANGGSMVVSYDSFSVTEETNSFEAHVNFQNVPTSTTPPAGYLADYGREFGFSNVTLGANTYQYGWFNAANDQPINTIANGGAGRNRIAVSYATASLQDQLAGTLMHFQGDNIGTWNGQNRGNELYWELEIPNGTYEVTVGLGDKSSSVDSRHSATVEGYTVIAAFEPLPQETKIASIIVSVTDGRLTVNGLGGFNSKITHIDVVESTGIPASGNLVFTPSAVNESLAEGTTGNFTSDLSGSGAVNIGMIINDDITLADDWLTLPSSAALGTLNFTTDATTLVASDTRADALIATAAGFSPATLNANLTVTGPVSTDTDITSFSMPQETGAATIDATAHTVAIEVVNGTVLTALSPTIGLSAGASINPLSDTTQDFSAPFEYTVTAEDGTTTQVWTINVTEALANSFSYIENFDIYGTGNLNDISGGVWVNETGNNTSIPVVNQGLTPNTTHSLTISNITPVNDYQTLIDNPQDLIANVPFYFGTYFQVAELGTGNANRFRVAAKVDDASGTAKWIRQRIGRYNGEFNASLGLGGSGSNDGQTSVYPNQLLQYVVKGVWDGASTITYSYTIAPKITEVNNVWIPASSSQTVTGTPNLSRIFISSTSNVNVGKIGPIRLSTDYAAVVAELINSPANADFSASITDLTVAIDASASVDDGTITAYSWDFGNGDSDTGQTVSYTYPAAGSYTIILTVTDDGGVTSTATEEVTVEAPFVATFPYQINFQDAATTPPAGYVKDYGLPYGANEGGLTYGWIKLSDGQPIDLTTPSSGVGRNRNHGSISDIRLNTLVHMQGNDIGSWNGNRSNEGVWEVEVANGWYEVTMSVGDPNQDGQVTETPDHFIRVEGVTAIDIYNVDSTLPNGDAGRFTSGSAIVQVLDGKLTIDADDPGANNTKINYAIISQATDPRSTETAILTFVLPEETGAATIDATAFSVTVEVANGTDLTSLTPAITLSDGATITPDSGVSQDFSSDVTYTVTAEDTSTTQDWVVTITEAPSIATDITLFTLVDQTGAASINTTDNTVTIEVANGTDLTALVPTIEVSADATISPLSGVSQDFSSDVTYTVTAQDGTTTQDWEVTVNEAPSIATDITLFTLLDQTGAASINTTDNTVTIEVANGTDLTALVPTIEVSADATISPLSGVSQDFSGAVTYTVTAQDGTTFEDWEVTVNEAPSIATDITLFTLVEQTGVASINTTDNTVTIEVANGTDLTALVPTIEVSADATISPLSGVAQDFSAAVNYTVTAEDGITVEAWLVTVTEADPPANTENEILTFSFPEETDTAIIDTALFTVTLEVAAGTDLSSLSPTITLSSGATVVPNSGSVQDFASPVEYVVTAEDGISAQTWTIIVTEEIVPFAARINFSDKGRVPPADYAVDYGKNFSFSSLSLGAESYDYGWKLATDGTPFDASNDVAGNANGVGRNRIGANYATATDLEKLEGTLVHFQGDNIRNDSGVASWAGQARGNELYWELEIPNGVYSVTLGLGDKAAGNIDSRHSATVEGYTIIPAFVPISTETKLATLIVEVTDGLLTVNGLGGYNSKITHIEVLESTGTPVNGTLSFNPTTTSQVLVAEQSGTFSSTLSGSGATDIGLVISDNINTVSKIITDSNDWLTIPSTDVLGQFDFDMTAIGIAAGEVRSNTIIATAKGFTPAILNADLTVESPSTACTPLSTLDCDQLEATLPLSLDFTIANGNLSESGLTMVLEPSARLATDDALADANVPGYAPSLISQGSTGLSVTSTKGIFYSQPVGTPRSNNTNSQMNALGVGITAPSAPFSVTSTLENPDFSVSTGNSSQQAGIWFGLDEDHYMKLAIIKTGNTSRKVQLQVENMDNTTAATAYLEINTGNIASDTGDITLRMELDPINNTIRGYYTLDGGTEVLVSDAGGDSLPVPPAYFDGISYDTANTSNLLNFAGIFTTHRNSAVDQSITAVFKDFEIVVEDIPLALLFSETELSFSGNESTAIASQSVTVSATSGNPSIILSDDPDASSWLVIPTSPVLGDIEFGIQPNLPIGMYSTTIIVQDEPDLGYANAELSISLDVTEETNDFATKINFSDLATAPPVGYERDSGLPFGDRGNGLNYGWLETDGTTLLNLSGNARNRGYTSVSVLQNTLIHMQYGDTGGSNGNTTEGIWEIEVPDGSYLVNVEVGDPDNDSSNPQHSINAEGVLLVDKFVPSGAAGSPSHFELGSAIVIVSDGRLTIDASGGTNTKITSIEITATNGGVQTPAIVGLTPVDGAVNVSVNASISANDLFLPNFDVNGVAGVNNSTITNTTVRLFKQGNTTPIASSANGTGGGDAISLVPSLPLEANTTYVFEIDGVQDTAGETFAFFTSSFTTGSGGSGPTTDLDNVSFTNAGVVGSGGKYSTLTIGPDDKLYGLKINGDIHRWNMAADGTLNGEEVLTDWKSGYSSRAAIGLAFDPNSTPANLTAYISHQSGALSNAPDWDGKISRISGANLENEELLVTDLPRSLRDHLTNSIAFNPSEPTMLYFNQGSNSAAGAPDNSWGNREESLLTAANLRLDLSLLPTTLPLNARTTRNLTAINNVDTNSATLDGLYNPYYINAPLTLFATGIRNAYDLLWHTNGQLYIPTNGTAGGSNAPASVNGTRRPDGTFYDHSNPLYPVIPASNGNNTQRDWLFRIDPNSTIGYYGHPNPFRGEFVLNRGDADVNNGVYNGIQADANYRGAAFDFEFNKSPNGVIEYRSDAENGNLKGAILVVRYSGGSDIIALVPDGPNGDVLTFKEGIPGFTGFQDPLDLVENVNNGNIYVSDYGRSEIVLLKPNNAAAPEPLIVLNTEEVTGDAITNSGTYTQEITISNLGNATLNNISAQITGANDNQFSIVGLPASINVQNSGSFQVVFTPTSNGPKFAELTLSGTDAEPVIVQLHGLGKTGLGGGNEPSLQWILDTHLGNGLVDVGDTNPATNIINLSNGATYNNLLGDELDIQKFERAIEAPITLELLSVYGPTSTNPVVAFGWYESGNAPSTNELFTVTNSPARNGQTLNAPITGVTEFDPGITTFGFYSRWPFFADRQLYSEDALNTFANAIPHHVRVYELPGEDNAYIIATEEHISGFDYQDIVVIARNIKPFGGLPTIAATPEKIIFEVTVNNDGSNTDSQTVVVSNDGDEVLNITSASIAGSFANQFNAVQPSGAVTLNPGENQIYNVTYAPELNNSNLGYQEASLLIESNASANPSLSIGLHALKKAGFDGGEEPSLQAVVDALGIGIDVGWTSLTNGTDANPVGDESEVELWIRATNAPINVTPVGRYSPAETLPFGWYTNDNSLVTNQVGVLSGDVPESQTLFPDISSGDSSFDPQGAVFGFYVESNTFNRLSYTEDAINTGGVQHRTRIYPMADRAGIPVENSYLIAFEDASNGDYQDYIFIIDNVIPFEDGTLVMNFDKQDLDFVASLNQTDVAEQQVTLSANGGITANEITLTASEDWIVLPPNYQLGSPFDIAIDITGLSIGMYQATITASAPNYSDAVINVDLSVTNELVYTYQFNFQDPDDIQVSPTDYIDDIGVPYGVQSTTLGNLTYGWVLPGSLTPADAGVNGRNRNGDALLSTFTIIGHRTSATFPQLDWVANVPNGTYSVNVSVGDPDFTDSNHVLDVNGNTIIDFDQQNNNPGNLTSFENTDVVEVTDGTLRLSLGTGGVNAKPNYIRLAPFDISLFPPSVIATFDGNLSSTDTYRGFVEITLDATDESESGGIASLEYVLDGNQIQTYSTPISVTTEGTHILVVTAEDNNGNVSEKTFNFTIEAPTGALLTLENMTKVPGTNRGFPADDYFTFYRLGTLGQAEVHDSNIMRLNSTGTGDLVITSVNVSDVNDYAFEILDATGAPVTLPISIPTGSFADLDITFIGTTGNGNNGIFVESIEIISNADNALENTAILHGGYAPQPEGGDEINAQEVFDAFGFQSSMLSIVNDNGTITPANGTPFRPSSNYPDPANIDAGYEGDMILSSTFVQADPNEPVIGIQLSALHGGPGSNGASFIRTNDLGIVGGMSFSHDANWYQTLFPKSGADINFDSANSITEPFRINISGQNTSGRTNADGQELLGIRMYKVIDHNGNVIPNEYIGLMDFIANGCGAGSANCDWNDNSFYFINIRPEAVPSASPTEDLLVNIDELFDVDINQFFDKGYPGNSLVITASVDSGALPVWINFNPETGLLEGTPPSGTTGSLVVTFDAVDTNEISVSTTLTISINEPPVAVDDEAVTEQNLTINLDQLLANDSEPNGEDITIVSLDAPLNGTAELNMQGTEVLYTPNTDYIGQDSFVYIIEDGSGLSATATVLITVNEVNQAPVAIIGTNVTEGPAALVVQFTGSTSTDDDNNIISYEWDFGDSVGTSIDADAEYIYNSIGVYQASLTVTDNFGLTNTTNVTITVTGISNTAPTAVATVTPVGGSNTLQFDFDGSASTDTESTLTYQWDFGDGTPVSTAVQTSHTYTNSGNYTVTLTVVDAGNLTNVTTTAVQAGTPVIVGDFALRINAGGPELTHEGEVFLADQGFVGGKVFANTNATVPTLYQTERSASPPTFGYDIPIENGDYRLTLHFAEIWWGATGGGPVGTAQRIFDVVMEGNTILDDYDINADVGSQTEVIKTFDVSIEDGELNLFFDAAGNDGVNQPKLSAIEIVDLVTSRLPIVDTGDDQVVTLPTDSVVLSGSGSDPDGGTVTYQWSQESGPGTATLSGSTSDELTAGDLVEGDYVFRLTVTDDEGETAFDDVTVQVDPEEVVNDFALRINTGGGTTTYLGDTFIADQYRTDGSVFTVDFPISGTPDDEIYQSEVYSRRATPFSYEIPVGDNGEYDVRLHFAELYFGVQAGGLGSRVFDVSIEGNVVLSNFDILSEVAPATSLIKEFTDILVSDGFVSIEFTGITQRAKISAIEILNSSGSAKTGGSENIFEEVVSNTEAIIPENKTLKISQNVIQILPNPASVEIQVTLSDVTLDLTKLMIYDIGGRLVRTYDGVSDKIGAGEYYFNISSLESGMYYLTITTSNNNNSKHKLIIRK